MAKKKKIKILITFRDSHRKFVRKTIAEAKYLTSGENPIEVRKLKLFRTCVGSFKFWIVTSLSG